MFNRNASPDKDDTLIVFRGDGNIIVDSSVRQEFARLHSDDHGWLLPRVPPVPLYEWLKPDDTPYEHGRAFVIAREGPHPDRDDEFKSWTVKIIFAAAAVGDTWSATVGPAEAGDFPRVCHRVSGIGVRGHHDGYAVDRRADHRGAGTARGG